MAWCCVHCGCQIDSIGADKCPNCEQNPFKTEPDELLDVSPGNFRKFLANGKLKARKSASEKLE
jgi:hypothetical protein